jgi:hypothetical protein
LYIMDKNSFMTLGQGWKTFYSQYLLIYKSLPN